MTLHTYENCISCCVRNPCPVQTTCCENALPKVLWIEKYVGANCVNNSFITNVLVWNEVDAWEGGPYELGYSETRTVSFRLTCTDGLLELAVTFSDACTSTSGGVIGSGNWSDIIIDCGPPFSSIWVQDYYTGDIEDCDCVEGQIIGWRIFDPGNCNEFCTDECDVCNQSMSTIWSVFLFPIGDGTCETCTEELTHEWLLENVGGCTWSINMGEICGEEQIMTLEWVSGTTWELNIGTLATGTCDNFKCNIDNVFNMVWSEECTGPETLTVHNPHDCTLDICNCLPKTKELNIDVIFAEGCPCLENFTTSLIWDEHPSCIFVSGGERAQPFPGWVGILSMDDCDGNHGSKFFFHLYCEGSELKLDVSAEMYTGGMVLETNIGLIFTLNYTDITCSPFYVFLDSNLTNGGIWNGSEYICNSTLDFLIYE